MKFWRKTPLIHSEPVLKLSELNFNKLPILQADKIIELLGLDARIKSIEKLTAAGGEYFTHLYRPALFKFIESAQLAPASASHHHSGPGGLVTHTLDVIDTALRIRKSYNLPLQAPAEVISSQEHVWTYAVFAGAMLHDAGKLICNTKLQLNNGKIWTPHDVPIFKSGATHYKIIFGLPKYKTHTLLANGLLHLLPAKGRGWLSQYPDILAQLTAWLAGNLYDCGAIGDIVRLADGQSAAKNLKLGGQEQRFPNAPSAPLVERITNALRQLLDEGLLKVNRPEGSAGWTDDHYTYLVCGTVADAVRQQLQRTGATDIPSDNTRIFDTWQEHGYVESTPDNRAIWHLTVNNQLQLTVLKFETNRLFHPSRRPEPYPGELSIDASKVELAQNTKPQPVKTDEVITSETKKPALEQPAQPNAYQDNTFKSGGTPTTSQGEQDQIPVEESRSQNAQDIVDTAPDSPNNSHVKDFYMANQVASEAAVQAKSAQSDVQYDLEDPDVAQHFLDWIRAGIRDGKIFVNRSDALVHIVKEGALIVSPKTFKQFVKTHNLVDYDKTKNKNEAETHAATALQRKLTKMMSKAKLHRKTQKGLNIHTYLIQGKEREVRIKGWLLPISAVYGDAKPPSPNKALMNISGFEEK